MRDGVRFTALLAALLLLCSQALAGAAPQQEIDRMAGWPNLPTPYVTRDWNEYAKKVTLLSFDGEAEEKYFPITYYFTREQPSTGGYTGLNFGTHTYLRQNQPMTGPGEAVTQLAAILTASLTDGLDARNIGGLDYVDMARIYFMRTPDGRGFISNNALGSDCTASFWYTLYPTLLYFHLAAQYPEDEALTQHMRQVADTWLDALPHITTWQAMGYSLKNNQLTFGGHTEPEGIFGVAYIMLMAHARFGEEKYLNAALDLMRQAGEMIENPYYEILGSYAPVIAARLNAEKNAGLPLDRMMDWVFTDGNHIARPGWGVIGSRWGDYDAYGLSGSLTDTNGYAFAMNTFVTAGALAPVARYAPEYSHDLGKYLTAVASNSHIFFADGLPLHLQEDGDYAAETGLYYLVYEGVRSRSREDASLSPYATGDAKTFSPDIPGTTFSFYSSGPMGLFSSIVGETNVPEILYFDLLKTDFEHGDAYPTYLLYNPLEEEKQVILPLPQGGPWDVFDAVSGEYLCKNVMDSAAFSLAADHAAQAVLLPAGAEIREEQGMLTANGIVVRYASCWAEMPDVQEYAMLKANHRVSLDLRLLPGDGIASWQVTMNGEEILSGRGMDAPYGFTLPSDLAPSGVLKFTAETVMGYRLSCAKPVQVLPGGYRSVLQLTGKELKKNFQRTNNCKVNLEDQGLRFTLSWGESVFSLPMTRLFASENPMLVIRMTESNAAWGVKLFINQTAETLVLRTPQQGEGEYLFSLGDELAARGLEQAHVKVQLVIQESSGKDALLQSLEIYTEGE